MAARRGMFDLRSKEEKEQDFKKYFNLIFPYGEPQREKVIHLLTELLPDYKKDYLILHYILVKEKVIKQEKTIDDSIRAAERKSTIKITDYLTAVLRNLVISDLKITNELKYPTKAEFLSRI